MKYDSLRIRIALYFFACAGILIACLLIFSNIGEGSIDLWDEALTAGRSLYVYNNSSIFNISVNNEISIRKPFLVYLLNALSFYLFGVNEFSLRFVNAFLGLSIFVLLFFACSKFTKLKYAFLSPWLLLGAYQLIEFSREALTDTYFTLGILLSVVAVISAVVYRQQYWLFFYGIGLGLALFTKGPAGLVIFFMLFPSLWVLKELKTLKYILWVTGFVTLFFLAWFLIQWTLYDDFLNVFLYEEYVQRFNYESNFLEHAIRGPSYYIANIWYYFRLTGVLSVISICLAIYCLMRHGIHSIPTELHITTISIIVYLIVISIASHKNGRYFMPLYPLLTLQLIIFLNYYAKHTFNAGTVIAYHLLLLLSIVVGLHTLKKHYEPIPDYLPNWKAVSYEAIDRANKKNALGYCTNDVWFSKVLHFYTNSLITVPCKTISNPKIIHVDIDIDRKSRRIMEYEIN